MLTRFLFTFLLIISFGIQASQELLDKAKACDEAKDYECAFEIYKPLAEEGNTDAQHGLYRAYFNGTGVDKNLSKAWQWVLKAADNGDALAQAYVGAIYLEALDHFQFIPKDVVKGMEYFEKASDQGLLRAQVLMLQIYAKPDYGLQDYSKYLKLLHRLADPANEHSSSMQYRLGEVYRRGIPSGLDVDIDEAIKWHHKAAQQGNEASYKRLGGIFEEGQGVEIDLEKAMTFYQKATELNPHYRYLIEDLQRKLATTELFGEKLLYAVRPELREAIKGAGAQVTREKDNYFADLYNSSSVLKESSELAVYYIDSEFASAQYTFPSHVDANQIVRIRDMVASKYGQPSSSTGKTSLGAASFLWDLEDGIELKVSRGWPDTTTYLTFTEPKTNENLQERLAELKAESKQKEYSEQSNAF